MSVMLAKLEESFRSLVNKPSDRKTDGIGLHPLKKRSLDSNDDGPVAKRQRLVNDPSSSGNGLSGLGFATIKEKVSRFTSWIKRSFTGTPSKAEETLKRTAKPHFYYQPTQAGNFGTPYSPVPRPTNPNFGDYRQTMNPGHSDSVNMGRGAVPKIVAPMSWNRSVNANNSSKVPQRQFVKNSTGVPFIQSGYIHTPYRPVQDKIFSDGSANRSASRPVQGGNGISGAKESARLAEKKRYEELLNTYTSVPLGQTLTNGRRANIFGPTVNTPRHNASLAAPMRSGKPIVIDLCDTTRPVTFTAEKPSRPAASPIMKVSHTSPMIMNLNTWERKFSTKMQHSTPIPQLARKVLPPPTAVIPTTPSNSKSSHEIGAKSPAVAAFEKTMNESKCMTTWIEDVAESLSSDTLRKDRAIREAHLQLKQCEEQKDQWEREMVHRIKTRLRLASQEPGILEDVYAEEPEPDVDEFPELGDEAEQKINRALGRGPGGEKLSEGFRIQITRADMATLSGLNWLNDEVINFYMEMIKERGESEDRPKIHAFNTFFYPKIAQSGQQSVKRWTKRVNIFEKDYLLIPVHLGMHWCLCVVSFQEKAVKFYDSMKGRGEDILKAVKQYLIDEKKDKKGEVFDTSGWSLVTVKDIPPQLNGSDCGVFTCKYADYICLNKKITFSQENMPYFRRRMVYEILTKKLLLS